MDKKRFITTIRSIEGWLGPTESVFLYTIAKTCAVPGDIVEIGSWKGKSTVAMALGLRIGRKKKKIYAVDPHEGVLVLGNGKTESTVHEFLRTIRTHGVRSLVVPVIKTSRDAAGAFASPVSFLFIDGLHDYKHAREDFLLWEGFVREGGIIAFHDAYCGHEGVWKMVHKHVWTYPISHIGAVGSIVYIRKGKPTGILCAVRVNAGKALLLLGTAVYRISAIPSWIRVFFSHKLIKLLLIDRVVLSVHSP